MFVAHLAPVSGETVMVSTGGTDVLGRVIVPSDKHTQSSPDILGGELHSQKDGKTDSRTVTEPAPPQTSHPIKKLINLWPGGWLATSLAT